MAEKSLVWQDTGNGRPVSSVGAASIASNLNGGGPLNVRRFVVSAISVVALVMSSLPAVAQEADPFDRARELPAAVGDLKLDSPLVGQSGPALGKMDESLLTAGGRPRILVRLAADAIAEVAAADGSRSQQQAQKEAVEAQQNEVLGDIRGLDPQANVLATLQTVLNAIVIEIDADALIELAEDPRVIRISRVVDYRLHLAETVPYIGATAVHNEGYDGLGVSVAVLDSGIDYYHANLGGSGDPADYVNDDPTVIEPGTFPTAKVVAGYDFVGSEWPNTPEQPDPDPLDDGPQAGHGTHVADIIGGLAGVAPGVDLYAVKVCSSVSTSCSGLALLQGMDFAVDPNGDGDTTDHVDIINMSLGSDYGTAFDDDLSLAVDNATAAGVLTVTSAGNGSDKPFVIGTPAAAPTSLAVAQTNVPSATQPLLSVVQPDPIVGDYAAVFQPWSGQLTSAIQAPMLYGDGSGGNLGGCSPFDTSLSGNIVLVDRGGCFFSDKIRNIQNGGGLVGIIGLVAPGEPFAGGFGGGDPISIPGYMIGQADSIALTGALPDTVINLDPARGIPLVMHMVGSSSRGPSTRDVLAKPEIGAPGASVSATAGTGTDTEPFGGTSGASPMVAGSAALVIQAAPDRPPLEIKAVLMNTGETDILNQPEFFGGRLAAITRIGGGEVRVDAAVHSPIAAWGTDSSGALSFGIVDVTDATVTISRQLDIHNYQSAPAHLTVTSSFRFPEDAASGAVQVVVPASVVVPARGHSTIDVQLIIDAGKLAPYVLNSGSGGNDANALTFQEFDGFINLAGVGNDPYDAIHVPFHVIPRASADDHIDTATPLSFDQIDESLGIALPAAIRDIVNNGAAPSTISTYSLIGTSPNLPEGGVGEGNPTPDLKYVGYATFPVPAGFCSPDPSFVMGFAINTWERQTHANAPASFDVLIDVDRDGVPDYDVFTFDLSLSGGIDDGRNVTWVLDLATFTASAFFFTNHPMQGANTEMFICGEQIGMNAANFFQPMDITALASDWYYAGANTDAITGMTISPLGERYLAITDAGIGTGVIPIDGTIPLTVVDFGPVGASPAEAGVLILSDTGPANHTEAFALMAPETPGLAISNSNDRSHPVFLDGATVTGTVFPFLSPAFPAQDITSVDFFLDGVALRTERRAPFDAFGGSLDIANPFHSVDLFDGVHVMTAIVDSPSGDRELSATFTTDNGEDFSMAYSDTVDRSDPQPLDGARTSGIIYPFLLPLFPDTVTSNVIFKVDGTTLNLERFAPYDVPCGNVDAGCGYDTSTLTDGEHTLSAHFSTTQGSQEISAAFEVSNPGE